MAGDQVLGDNDIWGQPQQPAAAPAAPAAPSPVAMNDDDVWGAPKQPDVQTSVPEMQAQSPAAPPSVPMSGTDHTVDQTPNLADPVNDQLFKRSAAGKIWDAMKVGYEEGGLGLPTIKKIQDANWFHEYDSGEKNFNQAVTDAILKPAAMAASVAAENFFKVGSAGVYGASQAAGKALTNNPVGRTISSAMYGMPVRAEDDQKMAGQVKELVDYMMLISGMSAEGYPIARSPAVAAEKAAVPEAAEIPMNTAAGPAMAASINTTARLNVPIEAESALMDKSGNLNMKYVNTAEDAQDILRKTAQTYADDNGTVIPHEQTIAEANDFMGKSAPVTSSKNFQDWFAGSKAVGEDGQPVQVYHGTPRAYDEMKDNDFHFFTADKEAANGYAKEGFMGEDPAGNVRPAYLNLTNPKVIDADGKAWSDIGEMPTRFHGSSSEIKLSDDYAMNGDNRNIYGQGFYTTDSLNIAKGYSKKGSGSNPTVYGVKASDAKLFDLEQDTTPEIEQTLKKSMGDNFPTENEKGQPLKNVREIFDEFRSESRNNGMTRDDVQSVFDGIRYNLEQQGYRGYQHIGGLKTKNEPHNVNVFWNPEQDLSIDPYKGGTSSNFEAELAKQEGHDGLIIKNVKDNVADNDVAKPSDVYVAFDKNQVRSSYDQAFSDRFQASVNDVANGIPDFLSKYNRGGPVNRQLSLASRQMVVQSTTNYLKAAKRFVETGDEADGAAATNAFKQLEMLQGVRHEVSAEAGRTLESHKITVGDQGLQDVADKLTNSKIDPEDLHKIAATLETPQEMAKFLNDAQKPSFTKMGLYYIMNNYLSGPITHLAYMASWGVQTLIRAGIETPIASLVGKVQDLAGKTLEPYEISDLMAEGKQIRERFDEADSMQGRPLLASDSAKMTSRLKDIDKMLGNATTVMPKEAAARFYGLGEGALDAVKAFGRALKEGQIQMLPGESTQSAKSFSGIKDISDLLKNPDKYRDNPGMSFGNNPIVNWGRSIQNPVLRTAFGIPIEAAGQVMGVPTRVIGAIHSMQKFFGYSESMNALAYRQAASEGLEGSIRDPATELGARIAQLKNNPSADMMSAAVDEGKYAALMGEPGEFGKRFEAVANTNGWTKVLIPFARVMNNINSQTFLERTPLGVFSKEIRDNLTGKNGNAAQATGWGRMSSGMILLTGAAYMAQKGQITGAGPDDKKEAAFNYLSGKPPYAVNIGGTNWPMRFFGIPGRSLALGSDVHDIIKTALNEDDSNAILGMAAHAVGKDILDETGMRGVSDLWNAINDYQRYGKYYFPNAIASMAVPMSVGQNQVNRYIDPVMRQTATPSFIETVKQAMMAKSPLTSQDLAPKVDIFGNPMRRDMDPSWAAHDPVMQALNDISVYPAPVANRLDNVRLTEQQYTDYATKAGKIFYNNMLQKVTAPEWQKMDADAQAEIIHQTQLKSRKDAHIYMRAAYPNLTMQSAEQNKGVAEDASQ